MADLPPGVKLVEYDPAPLAEKLRDLLNAHFAAEGIQPEGYTPVELTKMLASLAGVVAGIVQTHPDPRQPLRMFDQFVQYTFACGAGQPVSDHLDVDVPATGDGQTKH